MAFDEYCKGWNPFRSDSLMRSNRLLQTTCVVVAGIMALCTTPLQGSEVTVVLTKVDDGDAKYVQNGVHQDDNFTLLRQDSIPLTAADPGRPVKIAVYRTKTFQTMYGHGAAMTDSSAWVLMNLKRKNLQLYEYTMEKLFSSTKGAGFSFLRLPMGASDYTASATYYTYCDVRSPDLSHFSIAHDRLYIIPVLKDALQLNPEIRILGSPWSAPAWMKTNGKLAGISELDKAAGATCKLRPECFEAYADYFVKFIEQYQAEGIDIWGVTLQNEPQFDAAAYPCMRMNEDDQIRLVSLLGPKLAAKRLKTKIFVHDHNWGLHPGDRKVIRGDAKMDPLESVTKIFSNPTADKYIAGSAWHCYYGDANLMAKTYNTLHQRFPDKEILCTEHGGWGKNRGGWWGDVNWGMAHSWMGGPQNWCQASAEWNLALNDKFGPTPRPDSEAAGLVVIQTGNYQEAKFEREFYGLAQMSCAARPGSKHIAASFKGADPGSMDIVAFTLPNGRTSLVVFNRNQTEQSFQVEADGNFFAYIAPGHSIVTFAW
ncbi:MAG: glycoside hydrolase family 30 beta sandwich domain-containing protein [Sedimentisphaerales bacterium]